MSFAVKDTYFIDKIAPIIASVAKQPRLFALVAGKHCNNIS